LDPAGSGPHLEVDGPRDGQRSLEGPRGLLGLAAAGPGEKGEKGCGNRGGTGAKGSRHRAPRGIGRSRPPPRFESLDRLTLQAPLFIPRCCGRTRMTIGRVSITLALTAGLAALAPGFAGGPHAQSPARPAAVAIDADDIGGVVSGPNGPEAGIWVI